MRTIRCIRSSDRNTNASETELPSASFASSTGSMPTTPSRVKAISTQRAAGTRRPPGSASRAVGDLWLQAKSSAALRVPSVVLPEGWNYLLNPTHSHFDDVLSVHQAKPLDLDPRIVTRLQERLE